MKKTALVIDDNAEICELFSMAFVCAGFKVLVAYNGTQALELLTRHTIDFITLDHDMPGITGVEVLKELHRTDQLESTKVALVTANDAVTLDYNTMALVDLVLLKPVSFSQLVQLANRLMMQAGV
ncbi:MAG: response regulator [Anaerolineae bacterium]